MLLWKCIKPARALVCCSIAIIDTAHACAKADSCLPLISIIGGLLGNYYTLGCAIIDWSPPPRCERRLGLSWVSQVWHSTPIASTNTIREALLDYLEICPTEPGQFPSSFHVKYGTLNHFHISCLPSQHCNNVSRTSFFFTFVTITVTMESKADVRICGLMQQEVVCKTSLEGNFYFILDMWFARPNAPHLVESRTFRLTTRANVIGFFSRENIQLEVIGWSVSL